MRYNLPSFSLIDCVFGIVFKNLSPNPISPRFSLMLKFSFSFAFTFRSVIHLQLIFLKGVRSVPRIHCFTSGCPVEETILSLTLPLHLCHRSVDCILWFYSWALHSVLLTYLSVLLPALYCFDYYSFTVSCIVSSPVTLFFLSIVLAIQGL